MTKAIEAPMLQIPERTLKEWQDAIDIIVDLAGIPAGLIMRICDEDIEVFLASYSGGNPYRPGDRECLLNSGLYCETVVNTRRPLLVPDALADPRWRNNPDVKLGMISYLGFPILLPDGTPFGTICILDSKPNAYSQPICRLIEKFRDIIQSHLELLHTNTVLGENNRHLSDHLDELQVLRSLVPICTSCRRVRDSRGRWSSVEEYVLNHPQADHASGYCPDCSQKI